MARLFLAVWPTEDVIEELWLLPRKDVPGVRFVAPDNWHVTLRFLGEADPELVIGALDGAGRLPAALARYGPAVDVLGERVLAVPVDGLDELAGVVARATGSIGDAVPRRRYQAHLTVARLTGHGRHGPVRMPPALGTMVEADQEVEEIALVQSRLERTGARYETLATWPVGATPD